MKKFKLVVCGGTFDHFHKGHEAFLRFAISRSNKVLMGITSDEYVKKKGLNDSIEPYEVRKDSLSQFVGKIGALKQVEIQKIDSPDIPSAWALLPIEAIVVTEETVSGAELINRLRRKKGVRQLRVIKAPIILSENGKVISSLRIRNGEIDRLGKLYIRKEWLSKNLELPEKLRQFLKKPLGKLIRGSEENLSQAVKVLKREIKDKKHSSFITVGDVVTQSCNREKILLDGAVVDFKVQREERFKNLSELGFEHEKVSKTVENPSGMLTPALFNALKTVKVPFVIRIYGEEDLAVLPSILTSPLGIYVLYGQPHEGIVKVLVNEEKKNEVRDIVAQFEAK